MSLLSSLFSGVTGMTAYGNAMSIIGNNIANVNTSGFKAGRPIFGDILSQSLGGNSQIGRGVEMTKVDTLLGQGSFQTTENITDMAIDGNGFFVVKNANGTFFSRAGNFHFDASGFLVDPSGLRLQGSPIQNGNVTGSVVDVQIESLTGNPRPTGNGTTTGDGVKIAANLDSRLVTPALAFDPLSASSTSNFSTSITVYDSLGNGHLLNAYFRKEAALAAPPRNQWSYYITADGGDLTQDYAGTLPAVGSDTLTKGVQYVTGAGVLEFDSNGLLFRTGTTDSLGVTTFPANSIGQFNMYFSGGATSPQVIGLNIGDPTNPGNPPVLDANATGKTGITQYGATSAVSYQSQDGYTVGSLRNISISQKGVVTGIYTNGQTIDLYQIFLADFKSPSDLLKQGKNLWSQSKDSGEPIIGPPGASGKGTVVANSVELSNVDLAAEFVNMITIQRGFTANTRVIATSDQMLTELVNLKR